MNKSYLNWNNTMSQRCVGSQMEAPYVLCWQVWCSALQTHIHMTSSKLGQDIGYCGILKDLTAFNLTMKMKQDLLKPKTNCSETKCHISGDMNLLHDIASNINTAMRTWTFKIHLLAVLLQWNTNISSPFCNTCIHNCTLHSVMCMSYISASFCNGNKW
jgi:hypothetical protein